MSLPDDLLKFLNDGRSLEYDPAKCECGAVTLHPVDQIALIELTVNSYQTRWADEDPHENEPGAYIVPAYDLISSSDGYAPKGLLVFVPGLNVYGVYDDDHWDLRVFPKLTWWNIVADPPLYLNAQWYPTRCVGELLVPIDDFEFRPESNGE